MKLIAKKPCGFGGRRFYINDEIPVDLVSNPREQEKMGVLSIVGGETKTETIKVKVEAVTLKVPVEEGEMVLEVTSEGLQDVVNVLIGSADEAKATIDAMTDGDALILLHLTDSRKSVKTAAETRAKALNESVEEPNDNQESAGEQ